MFKKKVIRMEWINSYAVQKYRAEIREQERKIQQRNKIIRNICLTASIVLWSNIPVTNIHWIQVQWNSKNKYNARIQEIAKLTNTEINYTNTNNTHKIDIHSKYLSTATTVANAVLSEIINDQIKNNKWIYHIDPNNFSSKVTYNQKSDMYLVEYALPITKNKENKTKSIQIRTITTAIENQEIKNQALKWLEAWQNSIITNSSSCEASHTIQEITKHNSDNNIQTTGIYTTILIENTNTPKNYKKY